ncbi:unnamed protein product [Caenorhabditis bovis]|uniref:Nucleoporin Nup159/Nup146 N-terminal domain-containing protein n=1 Tax=Caenorhabditis bovis TaxID=2654633 RepID=A0A8S1FF24_9PELO|nr:unnamed protein product [Caenorhabditis bovis]
MNIEVKDLPTKNINLNGVEEINEIGVNSTGNLLAVLHTSSGNVFVDIFDIRKLCCSSDTKTISKIRVGTDPVNRGSAFEWNPAISEMFAVSSTDRSLLVVKIDPSDPNKQTVIGAKKLGAVVTAISWSPKGKQLTIGDSCGKMVQLKPELEIVRTVQSPGESGQYFQVTGLCWLATTEWLISYSKDSNATAQDVFIMTCKKDKPTDWKQLSELSYANAKSHLYGSLLTSTQLLVDWNVVLVGNSRISQIVPVGKAKDEWQTWTVDDGKDIYLPVSSTGADSFPIGISIDRSATDQVPLNFDRSQMHRPSPVVLCLTSDGVLTAHHIISSNPSHTDVQIKAEELQFQGLHVSAVTSQAPATPAFVDVAVTSSSSIPAPLTPSSFLGAPLNTPKTSSTPTPAVATPPPPATPNLVSSTPVKNEEDDKKLQEKKEKLIGVISTINTSMKESSIELGKLTFATQNVQKSVTECSEVVKSSICDTEEVVFELKSLLRNIEETAVRTKQAIKDMDFEIEEKSEFVAELTDPEKILETLRDISETEKVVRFNKLETAADFLVQKFIECDSLLKSLKNTLADRETSLKQTVLSPLRFQNDANRFDNAAEEQTALKVMRNISRIILDIREKLQRNEMEYATLAKLTKFGEKQTSFPINSTNSAQKVAHYQIFNSTLSNGNSNSDIIDARRALAERMSKRGPVKTKNVAVKSYHQLVKHTKKPDMDTTDLASALLKMSTTPRRVMNTSIFATSTPSGKCDATTQATEEPIVKTVVVTVETPAPNPPASPVTVSTSTPKPTLTTTQITGTPIFSGGSLFGVKKLEPSPMAKKEPAKVFEPETLKQPETKPAEEPKESVTKVKEEPKESEKKPDKDEHAEKPVKEPDEIPKKNEEVTKEIERKDVKAEEKANQPEEVIDVVNEDPKPDETISQPEKLKIEETNAEPITEKKNEPAINFSFSTPTTSAGKTSSIFGGNSSTSGSSSLFGGGIAASSKSSQFGSFGQKTENAAATGTSAVNFSFNTAKPTTTTGNGFGAAFGGAAKPAFGVTENAKPAVDEGMEDDGMVASNSSTFGGFMSGLGSKSSANSTNSIFGSAASNNSGNTSNSWIFGKGQQQQQNAKPATFSFANAAAKASSQSPQQSASSIFGGGPKFGAAPSFGAKPTFVGSPASGGGGLSKNASIFGGATGQTGGGFAQFATGGGSAFGGGVQSASSSIFGGGSNAQPASSTSSIFGGGAPQKTSIAPYIMSMNYKKELENYEKNVEHHVEKIDRQLDEQLAELGQKFRNKSELLKTLEYENKITEEANNQMRMRLESLTKEVNSFDRDLRDSEDKLKATERQIMDLKAKLPGKLKTIEELKSELNEKRRNITEKTQTISNYRINQTEQAMKNRLEKARKKMETVKQKKDAQDKKIARLRDDIAKSEKSYDKIENKIRDEIKRQFENESKKNEIERRIRIFEAENFGLDDEFQKLLIRLNQNDSEQEMDEDKRINELEILLLKGERYLKKLVEKRNEIKALLNSPDNIVKTSDLELELDLVEKPMESGANSNLEKRHSRKAWKEMEQLKRAIIQYKREYEALNASRKRLTEEKEKLEKDLEDEQKNANNAAFELKNAENIRVFEINEESRKLKPSILIETINEKNEKIAAEKKKNFAERNEKLREENQLRRVEIENLKRKIENLERKLQSFSHQDLIEYENLKSAKAGDLRHLKRQYHDGVMTLNLLHKKLKNRVLQREAALTKANSVVHLATNIRNDRNREIEELQKDIYGIESKSSAN